MTFTMISRLLRDQSPNKDGLGLTVILTSEEASIIASHMHASAGPSLAELLENALQELNRGSKIEYEYDPKSRTFTT
jgi:hypothetical protein